MRLLPLLLSLSCCAADFIGKLPLAFEARHGEFVSHGEGYSLSIARDAARLKWGVSNLEIRVIGANRATVPEDLEPLPAHANYYRGRNLHESFELYSRVRRRGVYPGIDLVFRGNQSELEYDFVLAPGRDPGRIALAFEGAHRIRIASNGDLILSAGAAEVRQPKPEAYQAIAGIRRPISVAYQLDSSNHVHFRVGRRDPKYSLVIDPQVLFSNSFGGSASSHGEAIALDDQGNIYVAGQTSSADFPSQNAFQGRAGAAALISSADGGQTWTSPPVGAAASVHWIAAAPGQPLLLYALSGGSALRSIDGGASWTAPANRGLTSVPSAIAVDSGSPSTLYAASISQGVFISTDSAASWTAVTKGLIPMNSNGPAQLRNIVAHPAKAGTVFAISASPSEVYRSADFGQTWTALSIQAVTGNIPQALVFDAANPNTMYLGQQSGAFLRSLDGGDTWTIQSTGIRLPTAKALAISPANPSMLYAATSDALLRTSDEGQTWTNLLPGFFSSVSTDPGNPNTVYALDLSGLNRSADSGQTWTRTAPPRVASPVSLFVSPADSRVFIGGNTQTDVFITKWSPDGSRILYSTYLGGSRNEDSTGLTVDKAGNAYVTGYTTSQDFPVSENALQKSFAGFQSAFVSKISPDGSQLVYSTLLPATTSAGIAVDRDGNAIISGSTLFGIQRIPGCNTDPTANIPTSGSAFVTKISADGSSLIYSSQINGSCWSAGQAVAADASGNVWITGQTTSRDLPVTEDALQPKFGGGVYDGFFARVDSSGAVAYLSYLGGAGHESMGGITFDQERNVYLTGSSPGLSQPASAGAFQANANAHCQIIFIGPPGYSPQGNAFVLKLDPEAHSVLGLTYLGDPFCLFPTSIAVDGSGAPWIAGGFSLFGSAPQTAAPLRIGIGNSFISKFSPDLTQLRFSTYFDSVSGLALDSSGMAYITGGGPLDPLLSKQQAYTMKLDPTPPSISLDAARPAATSPFLSFNVAIAPGEVIRIDGKNMGPSLRTPGVIDSGALAASVAGVQVTFDGVAVPLLSVSAQEIDLVAPFELAGKSATTVQVQYNGVKSNPVQIAVTGMAVEILALLNEDFTPNSAANPAKPGSVMTMYLSGAGQTNPSSRTGQINRPPLASAAMPLELQWFELDPGRGVTLLPITFAGAAPGLAAGILQVNFIAPQKSLPGVNLLLGGSGVARLNVEVR